MRHFVLSLTLTMASIAAPSATAQTPAEPWVRVIEQPQYFAIQVVDVDRAVAWYTAVLGLRRLDDTTADDGRWRIANLANDQLAVEVIFDRRAQPADRAHGFFKVGFRVPDVEAVADRAEAAIGERPQIVDFDRHGVRILQLRDPEDNIVQLTSALVVEEDGGDEATEVEGDEATEVEGGP